MLLSGFDSDLRLTVFDKHMVLLELFDIVPHNITFVVIFEILHANLEIIFCRLGGNRLTHQLRRKSKTST